MASEFRRNRGRTRLRSAAALLLAAVLATLANVLAARLCTSVNITPPLSERSKDILGQVSGEVEVIACFDTSSASYEPVEQVLANLRQTADTLSNLKLVVSTKDLSRDKEEIVDIVRRYNLSDRASGETRNFLIVHSVDPDASLILPEEDLFHSGDDSGDRNAADFIGETLIASTIWNLTTVRQDSVVYFLSGCGEYDPADYDAQSGYSTVAAALRRDLYGVRTLDPAQTPAVPADCSLLVVAGPRMNLPVRTLELLGNYLASGGRLLLLMGTPADEALNGLLRRWGIAVERTPHPGEKTEARLETSIGQFAGTQGRTFVFGNASVLRVDPDALSSSDADKPHVEILMRPSRVRTAFGVETAPRDTATPPTSAADSVATNDTVAVAIQRGVASEGTYHSGLNARMVVVGDAEFASNATADLGRNLDFFLSCVHWLTMRDLRAESHRKTYRKLDSGLSAERWPYAIIAVVVAWPLAILLFGALIRRR